MGVISARIDDADEEVLRCAGVSFTELFRRAASAEARKLRMLQALDRLEEIRANARPSTIKSEDIIRELRDAD